MSPPSRGRLSVVGELLKQKQIGTTILITSLPNQASFILPSLSLKRKRNTNLKPDTSGKLETLKLFHCYILCLHHPLLTCFSPCSQHRGIWEDVYTVIQILLFAFVSVFLSFLSFFLSSSAYFVLAYGIILFKPITINIFVVTGYMVLVMYVLIQL